MFFHSEEKFVFKISVVNAIFCRISRGHPSPKRPFNFKPGTDYRQINVIFVISIFKRQTYTYFK